VHLGHNLCPLDVSGHMLCRRLLCECQCLLVSLGAGQYGFAFTGHGQYPQCLHSWDRGSCRSAQRHRRLWTSPWVRSAPWAKMTQWTPSSQQRLIHARLVVASHPHCHGWLNVDVTVPRALLRGVASGEGRAGVGCRERNNRCGAMKSPAATRRRAFRCSEPSRRS